VSPFTPLIIILALLLVIPATILAGYRRPHGSIILSSGATLALSALFWLLGGPISLSFWLYNGNGFIILLLFSSGVLLLLASWTLSLNAAALARHWLWMALLLGAGLLTFSMILLMLSLLTIPEGAQCLFAPDSAVPVGVVCQPINPLVPPLIVVGYFVSPAVALLYAVRPSLLTRRPLCLRRTHQLPEGLTVSRLGATDEPSIERDLS
jgi:hypothetical protein